MDERSEQELREYELMDEVRAEVNKVITAYRRRMLNCIPDLLKDFKAEADAGRLPAIDDKYRRNVIRPRIAEQSTVVSGAARSALESGDE